MTIDLSTSPAPLRRAKDRAMAQKLSSISGGRPSIPLETEPVGFFHPLLAGVASPDHAHPVPGTLLIEEEPATWPELAG